MRVNNPEIVRRLSKRYGLEPGVIASLFELLPIVTPITNADELLADLVNAENSTLDLTGTAGTLVTAFTVPVGKLWRVRFVLTSTTVANSQWGWANLGGGIGLSYHAPQTAARYDFLSQPLVLPENWTLFRLATANAGDGAESMAIYRSEEDAF